VKNLLDVSAAFLFVHLDLECSDTCSLAFNDAWLVGRASDFETLDLLILLRRYGLDDDSDDWKLLFDGALQVTRECIVLLLIVLSRGIVFSAVDASPDHAIKVPTNVRWTP